MEGLAVITIALEWFALIGLGILFIAAARWFNRH